MTKKFDINDPGQCGSFQRLLYSSFRASSPYQWQSLKRQANNQLEVAVAAEGDTEKVALLNALCVALEEVPQAQ